MINKNIKVKKTILVCDDKENIREILRDFLEEAGFSVDTAPSGDIALLKIDKTFPDLLLTDLKMPGLSGLELMRESLRINPRLKIILMTAFGSIPSAVEAMREGAFEYLTKPIDYDLLLFQINQAIGHSDQLKSPEGMIGSSEKMLKLFSLLQRVAPSQANVLIQGESGTGKELIAKTLHFNSPRKEKPWVVVDCASLPDNLLESDLFGYEKGAFTGAIQKKKGRVEMAEGGTLFLDEIGELSLNLQAKLLRLIQERQFVRIGGVQTIQVNFRLVAATNRKLEKEVALGNFREDLFYRLNVIQFEAPPLRDRKEDIPLLVDHFVKKICHREGISLKRVTPPILELLCDYQWPGNVRELENSVERMILFSDGDQITHTGLWEPQESSKSSEKKSSTFDLGVVEQDLIERALNEALGNKAKAAALLGIGRKSLYTKLKKYQM